MIVLDTHAWLWWETGSRSLSRRASQAIGRADSIGVSVISAYEVTQLVSRGRIRLAAPIRTWVAEALGRDGVELLAVTPSIAVDAARLGFDGDPFDRMIYATARAEDAQLVTRDERMRAFDAANTLW